jgi:hypothetical protein
MDHVVEKGIDECSRSDSGSGMAHKACRLVEDRDIAILVQYVQRDSFREGLVRFGFGDAQCNPVVLPEDVACFDRGTIYEHIAFANPILDL